MHRFILVVALAASSTAFADEVTVHLRDGTEIAGTLANQRLPYFVDIRPHAAQPVRYERRRVRLEQVGETRARIYLDGAEVLGRVVQAGRDWFDFVPDVSRTVRITGSRIERIEWAERAGCSWVVPDEIPEPTLRVPMGLIVSALAIAAVAFPLYFSDSSVGDDDCADGCFGNRALTSLILWGVAGQLFSAGLFVALPLKRKRQRAWRQMQALSMGVSASRSNAGVRLRLDF